MREFGWDELENPLCGEVEPEDFRLWCYGKGGGGSPPPPPDPAATAAAQAQANKEAVRESALVNQISQITPWGNLTYTGEIGAPDRTVTQTLDPAQQELLDLTNQASAKYGQTANAQMDAVRAKLAQPIDYGALGAAPTVSDATRQSVAQAMYDRINPQLDRDREQLETRLANQGIMLGSEAYKDALGDFDRARTDTRLAIDAAAGNEMARDFGLQSQARNQAINEIAQQRQIPLNELSAMLTGTQVQSPQFLNTSQYNVQPADIMGATYGSYNGELNAYNAQQQRAAANTSALYGLGGALGGAAILKWSDRRLKTDIKRIGEHRGLPVYSYRYKWDCLPQIGFMADEVKAFCPEAVVRVGEYDAVDYARIV